MTGLGDKRAGHDTRRSSLPSRNLHRCPAGGFTFIPPQLFVRHLLDLPLLFPSSAPPIFLLFPSTLSFISAPPHTHLVPHLLDLLGDLAAGVLDLLLSGEEQQDVALGLTGVDLDDGADGRLQVVALRVLYGRKNKYRSVQKLCIEDSDPRGPSKGVDDGEVKD